ncbi:unnamed protein product, partial [Durusdinium trenchii]
MASPASPAWSPGHLKLPRKMGRVDFSVREAAFAVGMSPAREPPGMHPMPENEQELRMVQAERSERVDPSASRRARDEARFSLEAKVAASVEARLQVVEEAVLELNQDLMAAASQLRQIQAEPRGFELEKALDQRVMDLEEDLTLVVTEVELRLRHLSGHLNQDVATDVFDWPRRRRAIEGAYGGVHVVGTQENRIGSWCSRVGAQSHRGEVEPPIEVKKTSIIPSQELEEIREWMRNFEVELKKRCFGTEALQQVRTEVTHQLETEVLADVRQRLSFLGNEVEETKRGIEDLQALKEVQQKASRTDEDAKDMAKNTRELHQVITGLRRQVLSEFDALKDTKRGAEEIQQELADVGHRTSSFDNELKETRKDVEDMQKALREVTEKTARTDEDARNIVKSTRELHQVITEVRQRLSCIDTELKDAKKGSENMQQALKELRESKNTADIKSVVSADLQQELADIGHRTSSFDNELKETRKDVEDMQKALREVTEKTARTDEDAKNIVKSTRELHQVITEVRQRLSCFDTELKDAKRGSENMQQALKELRESKNTADIKSVVSADLQQELADVGHRASSFDNELKETRKDVEDMQKALREVKQKTARTDEDARNIMKSTRELHQVITELRERLNCFDADMKDAREGSQHLGQVVAGVQQQTDGFLFELTGMKKSKEEMQEVFREAQGHAQRDLQVLKGSFETLQQALEDVSEMVTQREAETKSRERVTEELHQVVAEVQQQMGGLQSELTNMRKGTEDMQEVFRKAQEDAQRDLGVLRVSCEALQQALEDVSEKITQQEAETKSKDRGTESLHQVVAEVQQQVGSLQSELPNMRKGTEEMQEVFREAQEDAQRDLGVLKDSCEALQQALEDVSEKVAQKEEAESSERGMEALHQVVSCFQSELTSMRNGTEDMQAKLGASEGDLRELWNACQQCQEVSTASQQEIQALKEKLVELQAGHGERTLPQLMEREEELLQSHSELQAEVKVLTLEARQSRHQGIKSQAELGQALASIEENRTSNARSFEDFEAKLHSVAQRAEECEAWQSNSRPEELWECCAQLLRSCELELTEERGQRAEEVAAVTTGLREQQDQGLKLQEHLWQLQEGPLESLALMAEEWRAGLCELRVALEDTAQEESLVELRSAVTLEMAEARSFVSESLAEQAERFSEELLQDSRRKGLELEGVRRQLLETVEDRIALRRQLLDMCRDRSAPRHGAPKRVAAERASEVEPGQQEGCG